MARTVSDSDGARHRRAAAGLGRLLRRDLSRLWQLLRPERPQSAGPWIDMVGQLVDVYGRAAAFLAAEVYDGQRVAAGVTGRFSVDLAEGPPAEQVEASLRWATKDIWPRDVEDPRTTWAQSQPQAVRLATAETKTAGAVEKLVLDQGRETTRRAVRSDRAAVGYARAAALGCCAFCALMSSRGAIYKDLDSVGREANERFTGADSVIKYHDFCRCQPIAVFAGQRFELSSHAAGWDRLYYEKAAGRSGDQLKLFRRAFAEHQRALGRPSTADSR